MPDTATLQITMPEMGESVTEGIVLEWHVSVGDFVNEGDTVVEVSTDKVDAEVPAPVSGTITALVAEVDDEVPVGQALAEMAPGDSSEETGGAPAAGPAADAPSSSSQAAGEDGASASPTDGTAVGSNGGNGSGNGNGSDADVKATPIARRVAEAQGISLAGLTPTGLGGKVTKDDVLNGGNGSNGSAAAPTAGEEKALRGPAAMLAKAMDESRAVPTATSFRTIAVDTLDAKRKAINAQLKERGLKTSFTHLVAWAIVEATKEIPVMVRTFAEKDGKPFAIENGPVNLGIAVDVTKKDGSHGLMVPAIKGSQDLDFQGFHSAFEDLIAKTRENKLTADDFVGTNISLTNPGGIGTVASVPRLLAGQSAIIATGSIAYPPEWSHASPERIKQLGVSKIMTLTSTYDHRVIQGAESGEFLRRVEQLLQGEDDFYEGVAADLGIEAAPITNAHPASASPAPLKRPSPARSTRSCCRRSRRRPRC
jgi:multifunctional 2-oxoglutarate metabolism enzyme